MTRTDIEAETAYRIGEYQFLKSWGYTDEHIAERLDLRLETLRALIRRKGATP